MKKNQARIRIAGMTERNCERILSVLKPLAKTWGKRTLFKVRKFDRRGDKLKYHSTMGEAMSVFYIDMTLPEETEDE